MTDLRKLLDEATSGSWRVEGREDAESGGAYKFVSGGKWSGKAWTHFARVVVRTNTGDSDSAEGVANARLIALAPDLAAALLKAEEALEDISRQKKTDELETEYEAECADFEAGFDTCVDVARATLTEIRKLTGAA